VALPLEKLGTRYDPRTATIDAAAARAYAAATNDANPLYLSGQAVPPVFGVVPTWDATLAALDDVIPSDIRVSLLHAEHDMHFHVPLMPGQVLSTQAEAYGIRPSRLGTRFTVRVRSCDDRGRLVLEQFGTMIVRVSDGEAGGGEPPDHAFPPPARDARVAQVTTHVDDDQTFRYRDASGDMNPIHVDDDVARAAGLPGVILHGVCTMAMCCAAVVDQVAGGDPTVLRRLAVRFYRPVYLGNDLVTTIFDAGPAGGRRVYAFEAASAGKTVIRDGRAELGEPA